MEPIDTIYEPQKQKKAAANGHFGIESRPWEQTDLADKLRQLSGI